MKKGKLFAAVLCSLSLIAGSVTPVSVFADGTKVVTLGADLSDAQKQTMMNYFNVSSGEVTIMYITNQDERDHLLGYIPVEQIGTRTVSCAYVKPTSSGGIKVKTANLNYVTGNMIASTLSTSGVKNCEVIAACPFEVSGTGALTGVQMAYETATGETLDETKKEIATQEMVVTGDLAQEIGTIEATNIINQTKIEVIENNITTNENYEITNIVNNVVNENNVNISADQINVIIDLIEKIAEEEYDYEDVKETLEHMDESINGSEESPEPAPETETPAETEPAEEAEPAEESILDNVDDSVLGEDVVQSSTEDQTLEQESYESNAETVDEGWEVYDEGSDSAEPAPENADVETDGVDVETDEFSVETDDGFTVYTEDGTESEYVPEDGGEIVDEGGFTEFVEGDTQFGLSDEEVANKIALLSEQARAQYEKAVYFTEGEYLGNYESMLQVYPDGMTTASVTIWDTEVAEKLAKAVADEYLTILADGTASYITTGEEVYFSTELNMMNDFLEKLFAVNDAQLDEGEEDILVSLSQEDRHMLYDDTIHFFENLYGESTSFENYEAEESYESYESYEESGEGEDAAY